MTSTAFATLVFSIFTTFAVRAGLLSLGEAIKEIIFLRSKGFHKISSPVERETQYLSYIRFGVKKLTRTERRQILECLENAINHAGYEDLKKNVA